MFEDTNQAEVQEVNVTEDDDLFSDYVPENTNDGDNISDYTPPEETQTTADTDESQTDADEQKTDEKTGQTSESKEKIKYNGQEVELTIDELKTIAQKGMNYDRVHEKYEELKNSKALKVFEKYAQQNGMSIDEYADKIDEVFEAQKVDKLVNDGVPQEVAEKLTRLEAKEKEREEQAKQEEAAKSKQAQFTKFVTEYPDVKATDVPQEVWDKFNNGDDLTSAYRAYENKVLKAKLEQMEQNKKNKEKAIGPVQSDNTEQKTDSFLSGLFG